MWFGLAPPALTLLTLGTMTTRKRLHQEEEEEEWQDASDEEPVKKKVCYDKHVLISIAYKLDL